MTSARIPGTVSIWRRGVLVLAVVLAPMLGLAVSVGEDLLRVTESIDTLIVGPAALVSTLACYAAWRIHPRPGLAFATIGLAVLGFQELARAGALLVSSEPVTGFRVLEGDVWQMLVVVVIVAVAHHLGRRPDPAAMGFGLGALVAASRLAGMDAHAELGQHPPRWAVCVVYGVVVLGLALVVSRGGNLAPHVEPVPRWARQLTALAIVMMGGAHLASYFGDTATTRFVVVVGATVGAALLVSTCLALFFGEVEAAERSRDTLNDELESALRVDRAHRARLHEIHSTIVGIASASQLLRSIQEISEQRRIQLDDMVSAELGRLERLVARANPDATSLTATQRGRSARPPRHRPGCHDRPHRRLPRGPWPASPLVALGTSREGTTRRCGGGVQRAARQCGQARPLGGGGDRRAARQLRRGRGPRRRPGRRPVPPHPALRVGCSRCKLVRAGHRAARRARSGATARGLSPDT